MTQYIKKPLPIEAFQVTENLKQVPSWLYESNESQIEGEKIIIAPHGGNPNGGFAEIGDYIIKGIAGEIYTCKPDIFEASYDVVTDTPTTNNIKTYTPVTSDAKNAVNNNKALEEQVLRVIDALENSDLDINKRSSALGRTNIEQGFMWLNRAIFKPARLSE